jgi:hypothetical protein
MGNLWCIGQQIKWFISNVTVASSNDGQIWSTGTPPFENYITCSSLCYHDSALVAFASNGDISYTNDYQTWSKGDIGVEGFTVTGSISTNKLVACGRRHYLITSDGYSDSTETAQIFDSITGEPDTFAMIYSQGLTPSGFNNIRYFPSADIGNHIQNPVCVAVGDRLGQPFAVFSTDLGETFSEISIPHQLSGAFYDVEYNQNTKEWYFGAMGFIAVADNLINPTWTTTQILDDEQLGITKIKINPDGQAVAINQKTIWYSENFENWVPYRAQGYQWRAVDWYDNKWIIAAESTLTQWTFWTSLDGKTWTPDNNQIYMTAFTIEP